MARSYSQAFLLDLNKVTEPTVGTDLAKLCVANNLPAAHVARALDVSRMTVYSWFRGKMVQPAQAEKIEKLIERIVAGTVTGELPAKSNRAAEEYLMQRSEVAL